MLFASSGLPILWATIATARMHEKHMATCMRIFATPLHLGFSIESSSFEALNVLSTAILLL